MKKIKLFITLLLLAAVSFNGTAQNDWEPAGLSGYQISKLALTPTNYLFAVDIDNMNLHLSTDFGNTWDSIYNEIQEVVTNSTGDIYISDTYANLILHSSNNGLNWQTINNGIAFNAIMKHLAVSNNDILYGWDEWNYALCRFDKNTLLWTQIPSGFSAIGTNVNVWNIDIALNGDIYLASNTGAMGVWRSIDDGLNWVNVLPSISTQQVGVNVNGDVYAATVSGIYLSVDNGNNWTLVSNSQIQSFAFSADGVVFASLYGGVLFSKNNGATWQVTYSGITGAGIYPIVLTTSDSLFIGTVANNKGVFRAGACSFRKSSSIMNTSVCSSFISPSGNYTWNTSGTYTDTIMNFYGCDSIITINLVLKNSFSTIVESACNSYTVPSGNETYTISGTYKDTIPNSLGCDSIITINLTINNTSSIINICENTNYTVPSGNSTYTVSGTYIDTIVNSVGCDSIITINLTIGGSSNSTLDIFVCEDYTSPSGNNTYTLSGTYMDTIPNSLGCDSIMTINLTVSNSVSYSTLNETSCDSYISPGGTLLLTSGIYNDTLINSLGCDSIISINLTINHSSNFTDTLSEIKKIVAMDRGAENWFGSSVCISGNYAIVGAYNVGSAYIFERDSSGNWTQKQKIVASDGVSSDDFGFSVSISGNYAIIGAFLQDRSATGTYYQQDAGAAYIFERDNSGNWTQKQKITATDRQTDDRFGFSVSISGNSAVIGAYYEDHGNTGVNIYNSGSAYIFERNSSGLWVQKQKIAAPDRSIQNRFGTSVSIYSNYVVIGSFSALDSSGGNSINNSGAAYVFERNGSGNWTQKQKIVASDRGADDYFGQAVSVKENSIIVSAVNDGEDAFGNNSLNKAGSAYIFERDTVKWNQKQKIVASDRNANDNFGGSLSMNGNYVIVGVGNKNNPYVFEKSGSGTWNEKQILVSSDVASGDYFGRSVSMDGINAIVGAFAEDEDTLGGNTLSRAGSAYVFELNSNSILYQASCDSFTLNNQTYNYSGTYQQTLFNTLGCDSVVTLVLTINNNAGIDTRTTCDSLVWIDGNTYTSSTSTPTFTITNATGCDSIITLNLTIKNSTSGTDIQTVCDSLTWIDGITYISNTNTPTFTLTNAAGCDSVVILNLSVNNSNSSTDIQTTCDSLTWIDGITYTSNTNTPTFTLTNAAGCDSVVTLNLSVNNSNSSTDIQTTCDSLTWIDGITYTTSTNTPTFTLTNATGCDSVVTLNLSISNSTSSTDVVNVCDSITWIDGITYISNTNTPTFNVTNAAGCDSVVTLNLTITNNDTSITQNINTLTVGATGATYQWLDCNNNNAIITGETNQSYIPASSGNYAVVVSKNGCTDTSACINFIITGISDLEKSYVKISPNPTTAEFIIELASFSQKTQLSIVSVEGKTVYTNNTINTNKIVINAADWSNGIYMVKITDKQSSQVVKLVKQ